MVAKAKGQHRTVGKSMKPVTAMTPPAHAQKGGEMIFYLLKRYLRFRNWIYEKLLLLCLWLLKEKIGPRKPKGYRIERENQLLN